MFRCEFFLQENKSKRTAAQNCKIYWTISREFCLLFTIKSCVSAENNGQLSVQKLIQLVPKRKFFIKSGSGQALEILSRAASSTHDLCNFSHCPDILPSRNLFCIAESKDVIECFLHRQYCKYFLQEIVTAVLHCQYTHVHEGR